MQHHPSPIPTSSFEQMLDLPEKSSSTVGRFRAKILQVKKRVGKKIYSNYGFGIIRITSRSIVKFGPFVRPTEASTLRFIARKTTIPVPRVFDVIVDDDRSCNIVMEFIDAPSLDKVWSSMTVAQKKHIVVELKSYVDQLRRLPHECPGIIEAIDGGSLLDRRLQTQPFGPFDGTEQFYAFRNHDFIRASPKYSDIHSLLDESKERLRTIVFTHGDLSPRNILVKDGHIIAVIDWESAGWYPDYWEFTRVPVSNYDCEEFTRLLLEAMEPYPTELAIEEVIDGEFVG
jgi:serine/threonine protein kinase